MPHYAASVNPLLGKPRELSIFFFRIFVKRNFKVAKRVEAIDVN